LYGLTGCTLNEIIQGRKDYNLVSSHRETDIAEICGLNPINIGGSFHESYEKGVAIKFREDLCNLSFSNVAWSLHVDRGKDSSRDRKGMCHKNKFTIPVANALQLLFDLRNMLMGERLVRVEGVHTLWMVRVGRGLRS
jgi:hypothetical protein